jgi:hypothetical protein
MRIVAGDSGRFMISYVWMDIAGITSGSIGYIVDWD